MEFRSAKPPCAALDLHYAPGADNYLQRRKEWRDGYPHRRTGDSKLMIAYPERFRFTRQHLDACPRWLFLKEEATQPYRFCKQLKRGRCSEKKQTTNGFRAGWR